MFAKIKFSVLRFVEWVKSFFVKEDTVLDIGEDVVVEDVVLEDDVTLEEETVEVTDLDFIDDIVNNVNPSSPVAGIIGLAATRASVNLVKQKVFAEKVKGLNFPDLNASTYRKLKEADGIILTKGDAKLLKKVKQQNPVEAKNLVNEIRTELEETLTSLDSVTVALIRENAVGYIDFVSAEMAK